MLLIMCPVTGQHTPDCSMLLIINESDQCIPKYLFWKKKVSEKGKLNEILRLCLSFKTTLTVVGFEIVTTPTPPTCGFH